MKKNKNNSHLKKIQKLQRETKTRQSAASEKAIILYEEYCRKHNCTSCANCCRTLGPRITRSDIHTLAKYTGMSERDLCDKYFRTDEDGDIVFVSMPCPFLLNNNLCSVYEARPRACRDYPHVDTQDFCKHLQLHAKNYKYCPAVRFVIDNLDN